MEHWIKMDYYVNYFGLKAYSLGKVYRLLSKAYGSLCILETT